jgi:hypothetical protein
MWYQWAKHQSQSMLELHKKVWLWSPIFSPDQDHEFSMNDYTKLDEQLAMHLITDVEESLQDREKRVGSHYSKK